MSIRSRVAFLVLVLLLPGCPAVWWGAGAVASYGVMQYGENDVRLDLEAPFQQTWDATIQVMRGLGYPVAETTPHGSTAGEFASGKAWVRVERFPTEGFTRLRVRVGTYGSKENTLAAEEIVREIGRRLGEAPAP